MKTLKIYQRTIKVRTGFKKYPFKESKQITLYQDGELIQNHHVRLMDWEKLRVPFVQVLSTRSKKEVEAFASNLGRSDADKWLKRVLDGIIERGSL